MLACETAVLEASGIVDAFGYFWHNPDLAWYLCGHDEEVRHFVRRAGRSCATRTPASTCGGTGSPTSTRRARTSTRLVHYLLEGGTAASHLPDGHRRPDARATRGRPRAPRRVCLFAGFDADGVVDDTVVAYVRELSRFADVYYLADCDLDGGELDKLAPYTKGRWAIRHGRYDFGSYSMLARDLVGWDAIEAYDELILANDSCYLVQPFDEVFAAMDARPARLVGPPGDLRRRSPADELRAAHGGPLRLGPAVEQP